MKRIAPICRSLFDQVVALAFLIVLSPTLALVAFLLRTNTDEPILVTDNLAKAGGMDLRTYRFRTTGRGTRAFLAVGRYLRHLSFDESPGLWAVVRGHISFEQFLALANRR
jgi:lipopolysaccharide/colanic/teichoic acid biosynthesis glycosyltransferase